MLPSSLTDHTVCIVGLGYVGLTLAVAMADCGYRVYGVERDPAILESLANRKAHFSEIGLDEKLSHQIALGRMSFSEKIEENCPATVFIVTVGTPVGGDKKTQFQALQSVIDAIAAVLKDGDLVILRSTVRLGTSRNFVMPVLDATGLQYDLAFCPERTLEGKAVEELRTLPQIVGGRDSHSAFRALQIFAMLTPTVVRVNDFETAEMIKLINNTQRDLIFAFANEVAMLCDTSGLSAKEVIQAGNIGYLRANLPLPGPVGGPCLEKDPYILAEGFEGFGVVPELALKGRAVNESIPEKTVRLFADEYARLVDTPPKRIAILGLAFKGRPETNDLRGTVAIQIIAQLREAFPAAELIGWDAVVGPAEIAALGLTPVDSLEKAFDGASIVVIQNNHLAFERMDIYSLSLGLTAPAIIFDYWCQRDPRNLRLADGVSDRGFGSFNVAL